ncbi:MAG: M48 family metallopeptidase [Xanthomonadales bacterium]|jgi:predicted Zn-dependent protease|nr:M48 family metallopeptidase [Xanthomonadales bacterium]
MNKRFTGLVVFVLLTALLAACATSPTGRRQLMLVSEDMAISESKQAYVQTVGELRKEGKLSNDKALVRRVNDITSRLVAQAIILRPDTADWEWSVAVIEDPETVNAWCMAGGRMAIYTGLVDRIQPSDDEIAQVMGHEISHALANHTAEKMSVAIASGIGVAVVGVMADNHGAATAAAATAAALAVTMPNSRSAETEADRIGIELAAKAGYDPAAAATLWKKMGALGGTPPQFLSTHPSPENRQERLSKLAPKMQAYYEADVERPRHPVTTLTALD